MIDLEALCVHLTKVTGIPARISSPIMNESNHRTNMSEVIHVMYHQLLSPDPDDLLLDSSQELGTDLVMVLKVVLVAAMSKYPAVGDTLLDAVAYYDPNLGGDESQRRLTPSSARFHLEQGLCLFDLDVVYTLDRTRTRDKYD